MLRNLIQRVEGKYDLHVRKEKIFLANINDINYEEIYNEDNIIIREDKIYYLPVTPQHAITEKIFQRIFFKSFIMKFGAEKYLIGTQQVPFFNLFTCGTTQIKVSDGGVEMKKNIHDWKSVLAVEVAFTNEDLDDLILESAHYLTSFTSLEYVFAVDLFVDRVDNIFLFLYVFKRRVISSEQDIKKLEEFIEKKYPKKQKENLENAARLDCYMIKNTKLELQLIFLIWILFTFDILPK